MIKFIVPFIFLFGTLALSGCGAEKENAPTAEKPFDSSIDEARTDSETEPKKSAGQEKVDLTRSTDPRITLKPKTIKPTAFTGKTVEDPTIQKIRSELMDEVALVLKTPKTECANTEFFRRIRAIEKALQFPWRTSVLSDSAYSEGCQVRAALREKNCQSLPESIRKDCEKLNASREVLQQGKNKNSSAEYAETVGLYEKYFIDVVVFSPNEYLN